MATAFQLVFAISTDWELLGNTPSDHDEASSQLPLTGLIQEFTGPALEELWSGITSPLERIFAPPDSVGMLKLTGRCLELHLAQLHLGGQSGGIRSEAHLLGTAAAWRKAIPSNPPMCRNRPPPVHGTALLSANWITDGLDIR